MISIILIELFNTSTITFINTYQIDLFYILLVIFSCIVFLFVYLLPRYFVYIVFYNLFQFLYIFLKHILVSIFSVFSYLIFFLEIILVFVTSHLQQSLCGNCPYSEFFWSVLSRIPIEYGEIRSIQTEWGKMRTGKTPNTNTSRNEQFVVILIILLTSLFFPLFFSVIIELDHSLFVYQFLLP